MGSSTDETARNEPGTAVEAVPAPKHIIRVSDTFALYMTIFSFDYDVLYHYF